MTEGTPAPTWEPGEPLYTHPHERGHGEGNYIRELVQEMCDEGYAVRVFLNGSPFWQVKCRGCLVGWGPDEGPRCWVCGKPSPDYDVAYDVAHHARTTENTVALVGGPRDGDCLEVATPSQTEYFLVPVPDIRLASYDDPLGGGDAPIHTGRYRRSHFNHPGRYWVYTYEENA